MSIFIDAVIESIIQVKDKTRIDVSNIFAQGITLTDVTIEPESGAGDISVFNIDSSKWYLDWAYATDGEKTITVTATDGISPQIETFTLSVLSSVDDNLYSNDSQLFQLETELKNYLPSGKNSYKYAHREAQNRILSYLDRKRIWNTDGTVVTKTQVNTADVARWSMFETLIVIYEDLVVSVGDKFKDKVARYTEQRNIERDRGAIRIDIDSDQSISTSEILELKTFNLVQV